MASFRPFVSLDSEVDFQQSTANKQSATSSFLSPDLTLANSSEVVGWAPLADVVTLAGASC